MTTPALPANLANNDVIDEPWVDAVTNVLTALAVTAWVAPTLGNAWVNFGGAYQVAQYRKVGDEVELRGVIKGGTMNVAAFTLPAGFRPPALNQFATVSGGVYGYITVDPTGNVNPAVGTNASFDLAPVRFSTVA